jgi:pilus assembly protein Flp/PilA
VKGRTFRQHGENMKELNDKNLVENQEEKGATMVEYALLAALVAIVCIAGITTLGQSASKSFSTIGSSLTSTNN